MINKLAANNKSIGQKIFKILKTLSYVIHVILFSIKYNDIKGRYLLFRKIIMMCVYSSYLLFRVSVTCQSISQL